MVTLLGINKYLLSFQFLLFLFLFGFGVLIYISLSHGSVFLNYMVGFYVGLLCFAFVLCLAASLPGSNVFVIVVVFIVPLVVQLLLLLSYEWQFDFIGCDYPAFENIHGGSHVVVRSGFS